MNVACFCGYSGAGKTTLIERVIPELTARGLRVSTVKHAHHKFDIDHPGKDSFRHRMAGAFEVVVASDQRLALVREFPRREQMSVHALIAELDTSVDWVLAEGFKESDLPKIEVWRAGVERSVRYPHDAHVVAVATDDAAALPEPPPHGMPMLDLNDAAAIAAWLVGSGSRFTYRA